MSVRAIPMILIAFFLYNVIAILAGPPSSEAPVAAGAPAVVESTEQSAGSSAADAIFREPLFSIPMLRGAKWTFSWGDLIILLTLILLFIELLKSTYTTGVSLVDHGLSMLVFIACLIEFLLVDRAATSVFFFIMIASLIDVVAGYTIGIRVARRDLNIGGGLGG